MVLGRVASIKKVPPSSSCRRRRQTTKNDDDDASRSHLFSRDCVVVRDFASAPRPLAPPAQSQASFARAKGTSRVATSASTTFFSFVGKDGIRFFSFLLVHISLTSPKKNLGKNLPLRSLQLFAAHPQGQRGDTLLQPVDYSVRFFRNLSEERRREKEKERESERATKKKAERGGKTTRDRRSAGFSLFFASASFSLSRFCLSRESSTRTLSCRSLRKHNER